MLSVNVSLRHGDEKEMHVNISDKLCSISFWNVNHHVTITFKNLEQVNNFVERIDQELLNYELENNPDIKHKIEESEYVQESEDYTHFLK